MKVIISIAFVFLTVHFYGQIEISQSVIDYGDIGPDTELEKELFFVNRSGKEALLLTNDFPREYQAHVSSKNVANGDTLYLRWKYTPFAKGNFKDQITLWFSTMDKPIGLTVRGKVNYIDPYASPACPNFNERPAGQERTFLTDFIVRDASTGEGVRKAQIKLVDRGVVLANLYTDKQGEKVAKLPIRYYYFQVHAEGYESSDLYSYVNSKNHRFIFDLIPLNIPEQETPAAEAVSENKEEEEIIEAGNVVEVIKEIPLPITEESDEFSSSKYKPNNIVFLVDVSGSMNSNGRLEILKSAMIELVSMMRVEDKISVVSYARNTNVLLNPTSGANKQEIIQKIRELSPQGATNGEKGLKKAYATAKSAFISKGNNRVYISTDGVFKVSEIASIDKLVKKNTRKKIYLSVLGIKGTPFTKKKMAELAADGNGSFIDMEDFESSAHKLKELIKDQSIIH